MLNQIEPGIRALVEAFIQSDKPNPSTLPISQRRQGYIESTVLAGDGPEMYQEFVDQLDQITLKVFKPSNEASLPITLYFHGGCFISGGFNTHQQQLRQLAQLSNSIVVCVQYRLAPEHCYPAAHDDAYQAAQLIRLHAQKYGGDPKRIVFVGDSAGAHLVLVTSLRLKTQADWLPTQQILLYPMLDAYGQSASYQQYGTDFVITAAMLLSGFELYLGNSGVTKNHPEISPLLREDLSGLPPTSIVTAEFDPLRDEGEQLYKKLVANGVEAYCERYLGVIHGFFQLSAVSSSARKCLENVASQIAR
ncbi:alpha/beta hydrolase [Agarivorans sp. QJM3NY_33]|uniref:alpha/beta hydrolase n=1 Tax=Agarivorans sp. QJM3NY_33 TaxID=3421432 RepID=UPI003D7F130D